jgi:phosphotransferase system enzyme I (PtsI)
MVSTVKEVLQARKLLESAAAKLRRKKVKIPAALPPLGTMIEVPGAALAADALAQVSDFLAIGSNDLTMYTLAVDRANEHVADLFDSLHPAVLRLIQFTTGAAMKARIPISICGEMAGDPKLTALLIGLGLRELSMSPANIPRVKQRILEMNAVAASNRANLIMDQVDSGRIRMLLEDFNSLS